MGRLSTVPPRAWAVTFAGTAVNLCLGILYAWSVWKSQLTAGPEHPAGSPMAGLNEGWSYLTEAQATWACVKNWRCRRWARSSMESASPHIQLEKSRDLTAVRWRRCARGSSPFGIRGQGANSVCI